jgi:hypothetical protein
MNNELERMWMGAILHSFEQLFQLLPGRAQENYEKQSVSQICI